MQLTFDDDEVKEDREEEVGLHTDGARTHHACCGRVRANPRQLQLPRRPLLARRLEAAAMPSNSAAAVLATSAAAVLIEERAGMPLEAAGDSDEAAEAALAIPTASGQNVGGQPAAIGRGHDGDEGGIRADGGRGGPRTR